MEKFRYSFLPELSKYADYKTYELKLTDVDGKEYTAKSEITAKPQVMLKMSFIKNLKQIDSGGNFLIEVKRLESKLVGVIDTEHSTGGDTPVTYYGYALNHNAKFHVTIKDVKGEDGIIFDTTFNVQAETNFPEDYNSSLKIKNKGSVTHYYNDYIYKNVPKEFKKKEEYEAMKIKTKEDITDKYYEYTFNNAFEPQGVFVSLKKEMNEHVEKVLTGIISRGWEPKIIWLFGVKSKEETYNELNLAIDSFKEAMDAMQENYKNKIYINFHAENVYTKMDVAYNIFNKFNDEKYFLPVQEKYRDEFKYDMEFNTFFAALATSRYDEANQILSKLQKEVAGQPTSALGLKRTDAQKTLGLMEPYIYILQREQRLYDTDKDIYNYYK